MSVAELPPIAPTRTGSAKSQRSSRGSSSGGPMPRGSVVRYERPPLLSVETSTVTDTGIAMNGRTAIKRCHISPGSNGSSSPSQQGVTPSQHCSPGRGMSRAKSWCANEVNAGPSPRLETLFEKNGISRREAKGNKSGHIVNKNSNIASKPPRVRLRSQPAPSSSMLVSMQSLSNSVSNLSKASDVNTGRVLRNSQTTAVQRNKSALFNSQKFKSEQNLLSMGNRTARFDHRSVQGTKRSPNPQNLRNNMKPARSNPVLNNMDTQSVDQTLTSLNLNNMKNLVCNDDDEGSDSDSERASRIHDWLMGVDTADCPTMQNIVEEQPKQTDTAIHIVYDKD